MARDNPTGATRPLRIPEQTYRQMDELVESADGVDDRQDLVVQMVAEAMRRKEAEERGGQQEPVYAPDPLGFAELFTKGAVRDPLRDEAFNGGERQ